MNPKVVIIGSGRLAGRLSSRFGWNTIGRDELNIEDYNSIRGIIKKYQPTHVINSAAITDISLCEMNPKLAFQVNYISACNIAEICKKFEIFSLQLSSDNAKNISNIYGLTKLLSEKNKFSSALRFNYFYDDTWYIKNIIYGTPVSLLHTNNFNPVHIDTVCDAISYIITNKIHGNLELGCDESFSYYFLATRLLKLFNIRNLNIRKISSIDLGYSINMDCKMTRNFGEPAFPNIILEDELLKLSRPNA